jgi:DNA-binding PadR family transcriptional regulator
MKLTRRQKEFILNLIELKDEMDRPIHYSVVAERLGVSPFTAYDMLCLLEEKGLVASEYQLTDKGGPGRAERLFYPSEAAEELTDEISQQFGGRAPKKEELEQMVMSGVDLGKIWNDELAGELFARVPDVDGGEIAYCVEIMTIVALRLQRGSGRKLLLDYLPEILPDGDRTRENLALLGGFAFGILAGECDEDDEWIQKLFLYIQQYLEIVLQLKPQECARLAEALSEVFARLTDEQNE